jgi:hypothetical protein
VVQLYIMMYRIMLLSNNLFSLLILNGQFRIYECFLLIVDTQLFYVHAPLLFLSAHKMKKVIQSLFQLAIQSAESLSLPHVLLISQTQLQTVESLLTYLFLKRKLVPLPLALILLLLTPSLSQHVFHLVFHVVQVSSL